MEHKPDLREALAGSIRAAALLHIMVLAGCGASGVGSGSAPADDSGSGNGPGLAAGKGSGQSIADAAPNVAGIVVGPVNIPYISITLCEPGSTGNCQTIDRIAVHTASSGLRILSAAISPQLLGKLPQQLRGNSNGALAECTPVADGYGWGGVRTADLKISGEAASGIPIQVMADPQFPAVPAACASEGPIVKNAASLGANGIIGVGPSLQDCGQDCMQEFGRYYVCTPGAGTCVPSLATLAEQVVNPVAKFARDNNGTIVELPPIPASGAGTLEGSLVFGIGTQSNNALGGAKVYPTDDFGALTVIYRGTTYTYGLIDSGSPINQVDDPSIRQCADGSGRYCPASPLSLSAVITSVGGSASILSFSVENAEGLLDNEPSFAAFNIAGTPYLPQVFDLGLPFFFGRNVFTAIDGQATADGLGPYYAF
ncbi:MAG: DUF3443 family protein [Steroidobacteraceae bacterium]